MRCTRTMTARGLVAGAVIAASVPALGAAAHGAERPAATFEPAAASAGLATTTEDHLTALINQERAAAGLPGLARHPRLDAHAAAHAAAMAAAGLHHSDLGALLGPWSGVGENVGAGGSVDIVHGALLASAPHQANMIGAGYSSVGVGIAVTPGTVWVVEVFAG